MRSKRGVVAAVCVSLLGVAGCGGGERQDKNEPDGDFAVSVVKADFPLEQSLAKQEEMSITVRNTGNETVPEIAVSLGETGRGGLVRGLTQRKSNPELADPERPIWIVDEAPTGGETAYVGTWALGSLPAGQTKTFKWKLTAVVPGKHTVKYTVAAGLDGKAKAQGPGGRPPGGVFDVNVSATPTPSTVDPETGKVVRGHLSR
jgi:hypothetical protein